MNTIERNYEQAKGGYIVIGVDTDTVLEEIRDIKIPMYYRQGDGVKGFLTSDGESTSKIMATGNFPGATQTPEKLRQDLEKAYSLIPGKHKLSFHAIYLDTEESVDPNEIEPKHFEKWVEWAKKEEIGLDFNPTFFSYPMIRDGFTLVHPDKEVCEYRIEHGKRGRKVAECFGKGTGQTSINNFWVPDGVKDNPIDRSTPQERLMESLDEIFTEELDGRYVQDVVESKPLGLGAEAHTVGSHEFYMGYRLIRDRLACLDTGHFHPTEMIPSRLSSLALFSKGIMLYVSHPVRWDSNHMVLMDDELQEIAKELVHNELLEETDIGLDFFDATTSRIAAWAIGMRNTQKALLKAMLEPVERLREMELAFDFTPRMAYMEELEDLPYAGVWDYFCYKNQVPVGLDWLGEVQKYQKDALELRR